MENIIRVVLIAVEIITCVLLIGVILLQQSKSQGMGVAFGGGMSDAIFGSRAGNILTKVTIILALIFFVNTTLLGITYTTKTESSIVDSATVPSTAPLQRAASQVPPPTQRGTLFTPDQEAAAPAQSEVVETVTVPQVPATDNSITIDETPAEPATP